MVLTETSGGGWEGWLQLYTTSAFWYVYMLCIIVYATCINKAIHIVCINQQQCMRYVYAYIIVCVGSVPYIYQSTASVWYVAIVYITAYVTWLQRMLQCRGVWNYRHCIEYSRTGMWLEYTIAILPLVICSTMRITSPGQNRSHAVSGGMRWGMTNMQDN